MVNIEKMASRYADPSDPQEKRLYIMYLEVFKEINEKEFISLIENEKTFRRFTRHFKRYLEMVRKEIVKNRKRKERIKQIKEEKFDEKMIVWILSLSFHNSVNRLDFSPASGSFSKRFFSSLPKTSLR